MSNYLAIATVTATLRDVLQKAVADRVQDAASGATLTVPGAVSGATVTTLRPEKAGNGNQNQAGVNLYLYQVTPNAAWRNSDIVIRWHDPADTDTRADKRPTDKIEQHIQVPLNLHYLLSFYGDEQKLEPQRLLGQVVGALEAQPIILLADIRAAIQSQSNPYLSTSNLDFQVENIERIKLAPLTLSLEDLSKLWSVFFQVPYALSVAYEASAVLIEPSPVSTIPVITQRNIGVDDLNHAQSEYDRRV
jgi:hypothetical protein